MLVVGPGVVEWVGARMGFQQYFPNATGIGWARGGKICCGVTYEGYNGASINAHIAAVEGRRWLTRKFLWAIFDYPFNQVGVGRITATIAEGNTAARRFNEHLGFTVEARLERAHPSGAIIVSRMFKDECRWISPAFSQRYGKGV